jgi:uncharacterized damage-inducible protein DinB
MEHSSRRPIVSDQSTFITPEALLAHWQGHRRVTRRLIAAYPDDQLFTFSVGGMRPFGVLAMEILTMGVPMLHGLISGEWSAPTDRGPLAKEELLRRWDACTSRLDELFPKLPAGRFATTMTAFGQFTAPLHDLILYVIDNEIHHRGQGYVYLRALGIEPPPFYDRS